jgi:secreted trypsin-like serine protease
MKSNQFTPVRHYASLLLLITAGALNATTFGSPDGNGHPYVGTLLYQSGDGSFYSCSGTMLSSTVMVTAAHCTSDPSYGKNLATWVKFDSDISFPGYANYSGLGDYLNDAKNGWIKADVFPHPYYQGTYPVTYDIGVAILKKAVKLTTYGALPPKGFLDTVTTVQENWFSVVGYGLQGYIKPFYQDKYSRYVSNTRLVELKSNSNGGESSAKYSNNPGKVSGGSCYGDSGGPVFYQNTNLLVSIVSWGITPCIGVDYNFRTDAKVAQDFLAGFLTASK